MNLAQFSNPLRRNVKQNSPLILSVAAGIGTLVTAYLTARATFKAAEVIRNREESNEFYFKSLSRKELLIERTTLVWKLYIPPVASGASTIACIVGSNRLGAQKLIAANAAFQVAENAFSEYREKVREVHGANKEQSIRDQIAEDKVKANAPAADVVLVGDGHVLSCELHTGRYFNSTMEILRAAQNKINAKIISHPYATLTDFYYEVGLPITSSSSNIGWHEGKMMELQFSTVLTEDNRPCLAFDYSYISPL